MNEELEYILDTAKHLVTRDRADQHGNAMVQFGTIADLWNVYLHGRFGSDTGVLRNYDVAQMMVLMKISRDIHGEYHQDTFIDQCGYSALAGMLRGVEHENQQD